MKEKGFIKQIEESGYASGNLTEADFNSFIESLRRNPKPQRPTLIVGRGMHEYMEATLKGDKETLARLDREFKEQYEKNQQATLAALREEYPHHIDAILALQEIKEETLSSWEPIVWRLKQWSATGYDYYLSVLFHKGEFKRYLSYHDEDTGYDSYSIERPVKDPIKFAQKIIKPHTV